jgi:protein TonB
VEPINVAENDTPPLPLEANTPPEYPDEARARGLEGVVILKLGVSETGKVVSIQVMKGDEPFLSAALAVVKKWKFSPALHADGAPFAAFIIQKIPFRLTN